MSFRRRAVLSRNARTIGAAAAILAGAATASAAAPGDVPVPRPHPGRAAPAETDARPDASPDKPGGVVGDVLGGAGALLGRSDDLAGSARSLLTSLATGQLALKAALDMIEAGDVAGALATAKAMGDQANRKLVAWNVATSGRREATLATLREAAALVPDWPGQRLMRLRREQALLRARPGHEAVIEALGGAEPPITDDATVLLVRAYLAAGRKDDAVALLKPFWRDQNLSARLETTILAEFGAMLGEADHKQRMDRLLYDQRIGEAERMAALLDADARALVEARAAVIRRARDAGKKLDALSTSAKQDPGYLYALIRHLRQTDRLKEAAAHMLAAPRDPAVLIDPDAWAEERRIIARGMIDEGDAATAYRVAAGNAAISSGTKVEIEFDAGWYALRHLGDAAKAAGHFAAIRDVSSMPLSQSRAEYWLGRAAEAAGDAAEAERQYRLAAGYATTFYGQLAIARLKQNHLPIAPAPAPDEAARKHFAELDMVKAIQRLTELGRGKETALFYRHLADVLTDPGELALLSAMAVERDNHQLALQIGKSAQARGLKVDALAFPTVAIPPLMRESAVEMPVIYAVARQESAFNVGAVSHAGARGLLQLMPATARETARMVGLPYSPGRLTSDAAYNATLGAAHLSGLINYFDGSYAMIFAAYNAGQGRVNQWIKAYGDPRDPKVDVIDWIERIPFSETRNYVQRTIENLQVYRARLGTPALHIETDLVGGRPG